MFIYKLAAAEASPSMVILEEKGAVGEYNRANRALMHFVENALPVVISWALNSFVYPLPSFVLMVIYCVGRVLYSIGYTGGYGKHAPGFMLQQLSMVTMLGLLLVVTITAGF